MVKFYMMIGLPASTKTTYAYKIAERDKALVYSSDDLRVELYGNINNQSHNEALFIELYKRIRDSLKAGKNVILDATNISYKKRISFLDTLKNIECDKIAIFMATPYEDCLRLNKLRERVVPEFIIKRMYENFNVPQRFEGFDSIEIVWNTFGRTFDGFDLFDELDEMDQITPYHTHTIGIHCKECYRICSKLSDNYELRIASLFHDISKPFVQQWNDEKKRCTYYQHHLVSAYDAMFYLREINQDSLLKIVNYIQFHMLPYNLISDKSKEKFIKLVGKEFFDNLLLLNYADTNAH